jgi:hypothetical protein
LGVQQANTLTLELFIFVKVVEVAGNRPAVSNHIGHGQIVVGCDGLVRDQVVLFEE